VPEARFVDLALPEHFPETTHHHAVATAGSLREGEIYSDDLRDCVLGSAEFREPATVIGSRSFKLSL
jgi:hypothetical protein